MFRGILLILATALAFMMLISSVVAIGMHRLATEQKETKVAWKPIAAKKPPSAAVLLTEPAPDPIPEQASAPVNERVFAWAKDAERHGLVELVDGVEGKYERRERQKTGQFAGKMRLQASQPGHEFTRYLIGFGAPGDFAEWTVNLTRAGQYELDLNYACSQSPEGFPFAIVAGATTLPFSTESTRDAFGFRLATITRVTLQAGKSRIRIAPRGRVPIEAMKIRGLQLVPVEERP